MRTLHILTITFALILLMAGPAAAEIIVNYHSTGFSLTSPYDTLKGCHCGTATDYIDVANEGSFPTIISLTAQSAFPPEWLRLGREQVMLEPGESVRVPIFIDVPCEASGAWTYTIHAQSNFGRTQQVSGMLETGKCQNIKLAVAETKPSVNLCEAQEYAVTIKNVADFRERYTFDLGPYTPYATIRGESAFTLDPQQTHELTLALQLPCDHPAGIYEIPFNIYSEKNNLLGTVTRELVVENRIDYGLRLRTQERYCGRVASELPIIISNLNDIDNTYTITLDGPGFVALDEQTLEIDSKRNGVLTAQLTPDRADYGVHTLTITVRSAIGEIVKQRQIELVIDECFEHQLSLIDIATPRHTAVCGEQEFTLNVRNDGLEEETFALERTGPSWIDLEREQITLLPGENANIALIADVPCTDETYDFTFLATNTDEEGISEQIELELHAMSREQAFNVELLQDEFTLTRDVEILPLIVKNTGIAGGTYQLALASELFVLEEQSITLEPGEEQVLHLHAREDLADYLDGRYLHELDLELSLERANVQFLRPFGVELQQHNWFVRAWEYLIHDTGFNRVGWCGIATLVLLLIAAVVLAADLRAWSGKCKVSRIARWEVRRGVSIALLGLAIIALVVGAVIGPADSMRAGDDRVIEADHIWPANTRYTIDASTYFDNGEHTYIAYQPAHIAVRMQGEIATLTPDHNFAGSERILFLARDDQGRVVTSDIIELYVSAPIERGFFVVWSTYCAMLNWLLIALVLVLASLLLIADGKRPSEPERKPAPVAAPPKAKRAVKKAAKKTKRKR